MRPHNGAAENGGRPQESHHELARGGVVDLVRSAGLLHAAAVDDDDVVGDLERLFLVVSHEHRGDVDLVMEASQPLAQLLADLRIEGAERLIEQQH